MYLFYKFYSSKRMLVNAIYIKKKQQQQKDIKPQHFPYLRYFFLMEAACYHAIANPVTEA